MLSKNLLFSLLISAFSASIFAVVTEITTQADFNNKVTNAPGLVVVDFHWVKCGPCKQLAPHYEKLSNEFQDVGFYKIESSVSEPAGLTGKYQVQGYPTVVFFVDGKKVDSTTGFSAGTLELMKSKINKYNSGAGGAATRSMPAMQQATPVVAAPAPEAAPAPAKRGRKSRGCSSCKSCK